MLPIIPLIQIDDFKINQIQKNLTDSVNNISRIPILDGILLKDVSIPTGSTVSIEHKLKRKYQGYFVTKLNANAVIWVGATTESETYLKLNSSANCTVDIWVF